MLRWILTLAFICASSVTIGLGHVWAVSTTFSTLCLTVFAFSAVLLIGCFEAYETRAVVVERDDH